MTSPCDHIRPHFEFVPGVRADLEDLGAWWERAEKYVEGGGYGTGHRFPYEAWATTRRLSLGRWAKMLAEDLEWRGRKCPVIPVCHSNGAELLIRAMKLNTDLAFPAVHLVAAACEADMEENGLYDAFVTGRIKQIHVYCSKGDGVLKHWAGLSRVLRIFGGGYGQAGYTGLMFGEHEVPDGWFGNIHIIRDDSQTHSSWLNETNLPRIMERVVGA